MPRVIFTPAITERLAAIQHDIWRAEMKRAGWRKGKRYDPVRKLHDALVPYRKLPEEDRFQARSWVETEEYEDRMRRECRGGPLRFYRRGAMRPFARGELRKGMRVRLDNDPDTEGVVIGWRAESDGRPEYISVRWADGEVCEYGNQEQCLARVDEA